MPPLTLLIKPASSLCNIDVYKRQGYARGEGSIHIL